MRTWEKWDNKELVDVFSKSSESIKLIEAEMDAHIPRDYKSVLDAACGFGAWYEFLTKNGAGYRGIDNCPEMLAKFKELHPEADANLGDLFDLGSIPERSSEAVVAFSVLFHIPSIIGILNDLWRITDKYLIFNLRIGEPKFMVDDRGYFYIWYSRKDFDLILSTLNPKPIIRLDTEITMTSWFGYRLVVLEKPEGV
jgi:SAM-dependent methyltransferase